MISGATRFIGGPLLWFARGGMGGCLAIVILMMTFMVARPASAQLTPVQKQEMKLHYEKATRAYDVQKYSEAVDEYQKAYEIGGDPAMLYNVAQSYRLADQLPDALRFYRRYLQRSPNARNREDVERKIADLEKTVEDRRKAAAAAASPVAPPPPPTITPAPPTTPPVAISEGNPSLRVAGIVVASVGAAALITAGITGKLAADKGDQLTNAAKNDGTFDPNVEASGKNLNKITIVSAIAGGALAVAGAVMIIVSGGSSSEAPAAAPQAFLSPIVGGGTMGAAATMRF